MACVPVIPPKRRPRLFLVHTTPSFLHPTHHGSLHLSGPDITSDTPSHTISTILRSSLPFPSQCPLIPWPTLLLPNPFTYSVSPFNPLEASKPKLPHRVLHLLSFRFPSRLTHTSLQECGDILTKKKLDPHRNRCHGATFTCIDCMVYFPGVQYRQHTVSLSLPNASDHHIWPDINMPKIPLPLTPSIRVA